MYIVLCCINCCESSLLRAKLCTGHDVGRQLASILGQHTYYQVTAAWWRCHTAAAIWALHVMFMSQLHLSKHFGRKRDSTSHSKVYAPHPVWYRKVSLAGNLESKVQLSKELWHWQRILMSQRWRDRFFTKYSIKSIEKYVLFETLTLFLSVLSLYC